MPQKEAEEEEDNCDEDSSHDDELVVPKVKVAEDGSLMLDEDRYLGSLWLTRVLVPVLYVQ